jgi:hypothetical protein
MEVTECSCNALNQVNGHNRRLGLYVNAALHGRSDRKWKRTEFAALCDTICESIEQHMKGHTFWQRSLDSKNLKPSELYRAIHCGTWHFNMMLIEKTVTPAIQRAGTASLHPTKMSAVWQIEMKFELASEESEASYLCVLAQLFSLQGTDNQNELYTWFHG